MRKARRLLYNLLIRQAFVLGYSSQSLFILCFTGLFEDLAHYLLQTEISAPGLAPFFLIRWYLICNLLLTDEHFVGLLIASFEASQIEHTLNVSEV